MAEPRSAAHIALLVIDVQRVVVDRYGELQQFLDRLGGAIETARAADTVVIYSPSDVLTSSEWKEQVRAAG